MSKIKKTLLLTLFVLFSIFSSAHIALAETKLLNISILPSYLAIAAPEDTVILNIPLAFGKVSAVNGLNASLGVSRIDNDLNGLQLGATFSGVRGDFRGASFMGLVSVTGKNFAGLGVSGLVNMVLDSMQGVQITAGYNVVLDNMSGFQLTPLFNLTGGAGKGVQIGNANLVGKDFSGMQLSYGFNYVGGKAYGLQLASANISGTLSGLQLGGLNFADSMNFAQLGLCNATPVSKGMQLGLLNIAKSSNGVMIGLVNIAGKMKGVPVGLVNLDKTTNVEWINTFSNINLFSTGIKINTNNFYTIFELGKSKQTKHKQPIDFGFYYGYNFDFGKWQISPDMGIRSYNNIKKDEQYYYVSLQARTSVSYRFNKFFSLHAGTGWDYTITKDNDERSDDGKLLYFLGFKLF